MKQAFYIFTAIALLGILVYLYSLKEPDQDPQLAPVGGPVEANLDSAWYTFVTGSSGNVERLSHLFQRDFTLGRCLQNGHRFIQSDGSVVDTTTTSQACFGGDGLKNTADRRGAISATKKTLHGGNCSNRVREKLLMLLARHDR